MQTMPTRSLPSVPAVDRYWLLDKVFTDVYDLMFTIDPDWGSEWHEMSRHIMNVFDALAPLVPLLLRDEIRRDPRRADDC